MNKLIIYLLILSILIFYNYSNYLNNRLYVYYLDIGQGDSTLIKTPDKKLILIDGGEGKLVVERMSRFIPFWERKIDLVISTHYDQDHIGGLFDVLDRYQIKNLMINHPPHSTFLTKSFDQKLAQKTGINIIYPSKDTDFKMGCCVMIDTLWPVDQQTAVTLKPNEQSISILLSYQKFKAFFGGDLPRNYEDKIAHEMGDIDILKIGHHGSRTSTSSYFVNQVKPELAIISCGLDNKFGHPHQETLDTLNNYGLEIYRTDFLGDIIVTVDKNSYKIEN